MLINADDLYDECVDGPCLLCGELDCLCPIEVFDYDCRQCRDSGECQECHGGGEVRGVYDSDTGIERCAACGGSGRCQCSPRRNY